MSFHEKSAWAAGLAMLFAYVPYFWTVFQNPTGFIGGFIGAVILLVIIIVLFHTINAIASPERWRSGAPPELDERDQAIESRASKWFGGVLSAVVGLWCVYAVGGLLTEFGREVARLQDSGSVPQWDSWSVPLSHVLIGIHLLFAGFVLANLVYYAAIVWGYRRGTV